MFRRKYGHRIRKLDNFDWWIFYSLFCLFFVWTGPLTFLLAYFVLRYLYRHVKYFFYKPYYRLVLRYLLANGFYVSKKVSGGRRAEKIKLHRVYVRVENWSTVHVFLEMTGERYLSSLDKLQGELEKLFFADFQEKNAVRDASVISRRSYSEFVFSDNREGLRLTVDEVSYDPKRGIELMRGVFWDFVHAPHLLITGGTGGGKSVLLFTLLKIIPTFGLVTICDPKKDDLATLGRYDVFSGQVFSETEDILSAIEWSVDFMDERYRAFGLDEDHKIGKNYSEYGLAPYFLLIDEWAAFFQSLDYKQQTSVVSFIQALILKGRKAGVFVILAMQRPDSENLKTALRDNMMARISVGRLRETGYEMTFGQENTSKAYRFVKGKIGRGYEALDGEMPSEFFSPFVPKNYSFEKTFSGMKPFETGETLFDGENRKEKVAYNLKSLVEALEQPERTVKNAIDLLKQSGYVFSLDSENNRGFTERDLMKLTDVFDVKSDGVTLSEAVDYVEKL